MVRKKRGKQCAYCSSTDADTNDHVPPKCLFPPSTRLNLITVPACTTCHNAFKLDDEYFRAMLSFRDDLLAGPDADFLIENTNRMLLNPLGAGFKESIIKNTAVITLRSEDGLYSIQRFAIKVDPTRIKNTTRRIIQGLYRKYFNKLLPLTHEVSVNILDFQKDNSALENPEIQEILVMLEKHGEKRQFDNIFELSFLSTDDDPDSTFWLIKLHNVFVAIGYTTPRNV